MAIGPKRIEWLQWVKVNPFAGRYTIKVLSGIQTAIKDDCGIVNGEGQAIANAAIAEVRAEKHG